MPPDQTRNELTIDEPSIPSTSRSSPLPFPSTPSSAPAFVSSPPNNLRIIFPLGIPSTPSTPDYTTYQDSRHTRRPTLSRHISSPPEHAASLRSTYRGGDRQGNASTLANLTRRLSRYAGPSPEQPEWTVFGQIMDREDSTARPGLRPHPSARMSRRIPSSRSVPHVAAVSEVNDEDFAPSVLQSPVSDPELDRHFPHSVHPDTPAYSTSDDEERSEDDEEEDDESTEDGRSSSSSSSDSGSLRSRNGDTPPPWYSWSRVPTIPTLYRNILKCSIAYFLASLFTYNDFLSGLVTALATNNAENRYPSPSGHMVATVAVYYNPAKTRGGMLEADRYCLMGLAFAGFVSLGSMNMYKWLEQFQALDWLADVLVIVWIGLGMSTVAWMKIWMAKPTFNTACSMFAIILFVVVVKEGGLPMLLQVALIVVIGSIVSNAVCYIIWPQSATQNLQTNMIKTLDSYSTLLNLLTSTFLLEEPLHHPSQEKIKKAVADHQASFTSLKKNLSEARSEGWFGGPNEGSLGVPGSGTGKAYQDAVDSLTRLAQHLSGLRSGTSMQYELTKSRVNVGRKGTLKRKASRKVPSSASQGNGVYAVDNGNGNGKAKQGVSVNVMDADAETMLKAAAAVFGDLVEELGPPLKPLVNTCMDAIKRLRETFAHRHRAGYNVEVSDFLQLVDAIERALFTFESTSNHAVLRLYNRGEFSGLNSRGSIYSLNDENPVTVGSENENIFLVYFFIFTLQEFARELVSLIDAMGRIYVAERVAASEPWWIVRIPKMMYRSLKKRFRKDIHSTVLPRTRGRTNTQTNSGLKRRISAYITRPSTPTHITSSFPKIKPHAPNTIQTPAASELSRIGRVKQYMWTLGDRMRGRDIKYAVKAGMATAMLAAPAFFSTTRPWFVEYRLEWALISFFVVMSPTIGATNYLSIHRVLGTLFGAVTAASIYTLFPDNAIVLAIFGLFYSLPCFYYIVSQPQYATTGRFVLLTYNLTCLYCYNTRQKDVSVVDIAFRRSLAVTVGVVWAFLVSRFWWPSEARRELSKALGEFCLNIGWLYTRLVASNSFSPEAVQEGFDEDEPTEESSLIPRKPKTTLSNSIEEFMSMELHLQIKLLELQDLLKQTQHEPRLKGPFPTQLYRSILTSLQKMLDNLHSMRCVTTREEWYTSVRRDFILPVNKERREMVGNIILYFSTLSSAYRLKVPLPPYLPPAEKARQNLVNAIRRLDVVKNRDIRGSRQLLFFAYALTMQSITKELDYLGRTTQDAFGVIGGSTEMFEELFREQAMGAEASV